MKIFKQIVAWSLLAVISLATIPLESFHHHEEHSVVCTDYTNHFEAKKFECELASFVLPVFTENENTFNFLVTSIKKEYLISKTTLHFDLRITDLSSRGPPYFSLVS